MKKILIITLILLLTACSTTKEEVKTDESKDSEKQTENIKADEEKVEKEGKLLEVGQIIEDEYGKVELLKIKEINQSIEQGPLKINLINAKIIKRTNLSKNYLDYINQFKAVDKDEGMTYVQLLYTVENTSNNDIGWDGLRYIISDKKEQIDAWNQEFIYVDNTNSFYGNVEQEYLQGFMLEKPDVNSLRLVFGDVYNQDSYDTITNKVEYTIEF